MWVSELNISLAIMNLDFSTHYVCGNGENWAAYGWIIFVHVMIVWLFFSLCAPPLELFYLFIF